MRTWVGTTRSGEGVYEHDDGTGTFWLENGGDVIRCRYCSRFIRPCVDKQCDGCWEVTSRLEAFMTQNLASYAFVSKLITKFERQAAETLKKTEQGR